MEKKPLKQVERFLLILLVSFIVLGTAPEKVFAVRNFNKTLGVSENLENTSLEADKLKDVLVREKNLAVDGENEKKIYLVFHANNTENPDKEELVKIPFTQEDKEYTIQQIDTMTSTTLNKDDAKLRNTFKRTPLVPYKFETREKDTYDLSFDKFRVENSSFIGWTTERYPKKDSSLILSNKTNERIENITQGTAKGMEGLKKTESLTYLRHTPGKSYVPNGYSIAVGKGYDTLQHDEDIHLYANYKPYFNIRVKPQFKAVDYTQGKGSYIATDKKMDLDVGLLFAPAKSDYKNPTVHEEDRFSAVETEDAVKKYDGINSLEWKLPGFDHLGRLLSYIAIVVPEDKKHNYSKSLINWLDFGITIYDKNLGVAVDPSAPKNLYNEKGFDSYGSDLAKTQVINSEVDVFTSATAVKPLIKSYGRFGPYEVEGYEIVMTNSPELLPIPFIYRPKTVDKQIEIRFGKLEKSAGITGIRLKIAGGEEVVLQKKWRTDEFVGAGYSASIKNERLIISSSEMNLQDKEDKFIEIKFVKKGLNNEIVGKSAKAQIKNVNVEQLTSSPITEMKQIRMREGSPVINFRVPNSDENQIKTGATYTAQVWDGISWEDVASIEIKDSDVKKISFDLLLDPQKVKDSSVIRIKSIEPGKLPSDSTGTGNEIYKEGQGAYVTLDLKGPTGEITAEDEPFRRFINIKGELDEDIGDEKVTLLIYGRGDLPLQKKEIPLTDKKTFIYKDYENILNGLEDVINMEIVAVDKFGNENSIKVGEYEKTYQFATELQSPRSKRNYMRFKPDIDDAQITITIKREGKIVHQQTFKELVKGKFTKVLLDKDFTFKVKDIVILDGVAMKNGHKHTTNPFMTEVTR